jgi:hypothetical protein
MKTSLGRTLLGTLSPGSFLQVDVLDILYGQA